MQCRDRPDGRQPAIAEYGFLSDCHPAALVDRCGSVDWWCVPASTPPSVFGRVLDPQAGHWTLRPEEDYTSSRGYVEETLVLRTVFATDTGEAGVTDSLLLEPAARGHDVGMHSPHVLLPRARGLAGFVRMQTQLAPRMENGRTEPHLRLVSGGAEAKGGPVTLTLKSGVSFTIREGLILSEFVVSAGHVVDPRGVSAAAGALQASPETCRAALLSIFGQLASQAR